MYIAPDPTLVIPGVEWAEQHGYRHVDKLSRTDAKIVLKVLKLSDQDASDAFGAMLFGNPWYWLEAFAKAGGQLGELHIHCKK